MGLEELKIDKKHSKIEVIKAGNEYKFLITITARSEEMSFEKMEATLAGEKVMVYYAPEFTPEALASILSEKRGFAYALVEAEKGTRISIFSGGNLVKEELEPVNTEKKALQLYKQGWDIFKTRFGYVAVPPEEHKELLQVATML